MTPGGGKDPRKRAEPRFNPENITWNRSCLETASEYRESGKMASRLSRIWPTLSRVRLSSALGSRCVSQTPKSSAAGAAVASDLQPVSPAAPDSHGHTEVSPFEKVRG